MALLGSLISVSPNCTGANLAVFDVTPEDGSPDAIGRIYLVEGTTETLIYQSSNPVNTLTSRTNWIFAIEHLTGIYNDVYEPLANPELAAIIESITNLNGLFKFEMIEDAEGGTSVFTYVLGTCAIDCCMANLLGTVINCNCEGGDCHDVIRKIEKILILIRCAVVDAANGDIAAAQEKYNKAAELCDSTCDCNC